MKRVPTLFALVAILAVAGGTSRALAGCGHCGSGKAAAAGAEGASSTATGSAKEAAEHPSVALHMGHIVEAGDHHFETVYLPHGVRVYFYAANGVPMKVGAAKGKATIRSADGKATTVALAPAVPKEGEPTAYFCPGHPDATQMEPGICAGCGTMKLMSQDYLEGPADLSKTPKGAKVEIVLENLKGAKSPVGFTGEFALAMIEPAGGKAKGGTEGHEGHNH